MTIAILTILASAIPFLIELLRQYLTNREDPQTQLAKADEKTDLAIAKQDVTDLNLQLTDVLQRLSNRANSNNSK